MFNWMWLIVFFVALTTLTQQVSGWAKEQLLKNPAKFRELNTRERAESDALLVQRLQELPERQAPAPNSADYENYKYHLFMNGLQDPKTGRIVVDLQKAKTEIVPSLTQLGFSVDELILEADGGAENRGQDFQIPLSRLEQDKPYFIYDPGPLGLQHYWRVVFKSGGQVVHVTDEKWVDQARFPRIAEKNYTQFAEFSLKLPTYFEQNEAWQANLVERAGKIQHQNVVWTVSDQSTNQALKKAFWQSGPDIRPQLLRDQRGKEIAWLLHLPGGKKLRVGLGEIIVKGGAAFSQNSFFWDEHFVAAARANSDTKIALDTLTYWMLTQQADGAIGRELDYKGTSFNRATYVKYGKAQPSRNFFNPPIEGWAWHEVIRWTPLASRPKIENVLLMLRNHRQWLLKSHGIYDKSGQLLGFQWSNRGSGRDNAPRPLDDLGIASLPEYGIRARPAPGRPANGLAVDLIAQYKSLIDYERELNLMLGQFERASGLSRESDEVSRTINKKYWNEKLGWYVDLIPEGAQAWVQAPIVNLTGFWVVAAKVPTAERVALMIKNYLFNPQKFGGPILTSIPMDDPNYHTYGHYWRGGGWPPDWEMVSRSLFEYGFREEATLLANRSLRAMTLAGEAFAQGDSPQFMLQTINAKPTNGSDPANAARVRAAIGSYYQKFWRGQISNPKALGRSTLFEFYGLRTNWAGESIPTYGSFISLEDATLHGTRVDFAGWGAVPPLRAPHYILGLDAVPAFFGQPSQLGEWLYQLLADPELRYHKTAQVPAIRHFLSQWPSNTPINKNQFIERFDSALRENYDFANQINFLRRGYIEISPVFDPLINQTALQNLMYNNEKLSLAIDQIPDNRVKVRVSGTSPVRVQLNRQWLNRGLDSMATNETQASTDIVEIKPGRAQLLKWQNLNPSASPAVPSGTGI